MEKTILPFILDIDIVIHIRDMEGTSDTSSECPSTAQARCLLWSTCLVHHVRCTPDTTLQPPVSQLKMGTVPRPVHSFGAHRAGPVHTEHHQTHLIQTSLSLVLIPIIPGLHLSYQALVFTSVHQIHSLRVCLDPLL
jgi:hypothetical protein